jgi:hypothetical protein
MKDRERLGAGDLGYPGTGDQGRSRPVVLGLFWGTLMALFCAAITTPWRGRLSRGVAPDAARLGAARFYGVDVAGIGSGSVPGCRMSEMLAIRTTSRNPMNAPVPGFLDARNRTRRARLRDCDPKVPHQRWLSVRPRNRYEVDVAVARSGELKGPRSSSRLAPSNIKARLRPQSEGAEVGIERQVVPANGGSLGTRPKITPYDAPRHHVRDRALWRPIDSNVELKTGKPSTSVRERHRKTHCPARARRAGIAENRFECARRGLTINSYSLSGRLSRAGTSGQHGDSKCPRGSSSSNTHNRHDALSHGNAPHPSVRCWLSSELRVRTASAAQPLVTFYRARRLRLLAHTGVASISQVPSVSSYSSVGG